MMMLRALGSNHDVRNARARLAAFRARVDNRLARHFRTKLHRLPAGQPMVSLTFDDIPDSAAEVGAPLVEAHGGRATFYVSGGLLQRWSGHWRGSDEAGIIALHARGHEIACHTFSHPRVTDIAPATLRAEIAENGRYLTGLDASMRLDNFAYPYGLASLSHKHFLADTFRSSRGILPGVNRDVVDLQFLRATPLVSIHIDRDGVDRVFDDLMASGSWLIFYSHDVAERPSPHGCTPDLLRHALKAASRRKLPIVTVAEALDRAGV
ncbi:MAG TPA: polysaccharide deacetylase family protein [Bradyrhizobium sp.]|nr:polysaccharide deacetylase family protein [Bradyrhizobium sp.]